VGVFSVANSPFQVYLLAGLGFAGYIFSKLDCPASPLLLGLILGPMMEENLRRALLISRGDPMVFLQSPISAFFLALTVLIVAISIMSAARHRAGAAARSAGAATLPKDDQA
jgi:putative tricarboxylic transport membrane protein